MALPTKSKPLLIQIGNGASPEVFSFVCGSNSYEIGIKKELAEVTVLDCDDPINAPAAVLRSVNSTDLSIKFEGISATENASALREWAESIDGKNIRVVFPGTAQEGGGYYQMRGILSDWNISGSGQETPKVSGTISPANGFTWVPAV